MTNEPSEAAWAEADRLVSANGGMYGKTLARVLQEHSDKAWEVKFALMHHGKRAGDPDFDAIQSMILPDDQDPLADALETVLSGFETRAHAERYAEHLREELAKRGLMIVEAFHTAELRSEAR